MQLKEKKIKETKISMLFIIWVFFMLIWVLLEPFLLVASTFVLKKMFQKNGINLFVFSFWDLDPFFFLIYLKKQKRQIKKLVIKKCNDENSVFFLSLQSLYGQLRKATYLAHYTVPHSYAKLTSNLFPSNCNFTSSRSFDAS